MRPVEVLTAEERVARGREHLEHAVVDPQDRDVERAAAEVVDGDRLLLPVLLEPVRERGRRRLVDDAEHFEARDAARVARGLALRVVEVRRDRDDRFLDLLAERFFAEFLDLAQRERGDLLGRIVPVADADLHVAVRRFDERVGQVLARVLDLGVRHLAADEPLHGVDRLRRVRDRLSLGDLADEPLAVLREADDRGRRPRPLAIRDDLRRTDLDDGHARVRRPEIDAENLTQVAPPRSSLRVPCNAGLAATFTRAGRSSRS